MQEYWHASGESEVKELRTGLTRVHRVSVTGVRTVTNERLKVSARFQKTGLSVFKEYAAWRIKCFLGTVELPPPLGTAHSVTVARYKELFIDRRWSQEYSAQRKSISSSFSCDSKPDVSRPPMKCPHSAVNVLDSVGLSEQT